MNIDILIEKLYTILEPGDVLLLFGKLGSGKTFFTRQLCQRFGVKENVSSPTYTLTNTYNIIPYQIHLNQEYITVLHTDLYRLPIVDLETFCQIYSTDAISIIEWSEKLTDEILQFMPNRLEIHFHTIEHRDSAQNSSSIALQDNNIFEKTEQEEIEIEYRVHIVKHGKFVEKAL